MAVEAVVTEVALFAGPSVAFVDMALPCTEVAVTGVAEPAGVFVELPGASEVVVSPSVVFAVLPAVELVDVAGPVSAVSVPLSGAKVVFVDEVVVT